MSTPWILLDSAVCFRVSGKDARRYLHNRLSQDIRSLESGSSAPAAALSAQGRVEGVFTVFCEADDSFIVVSDGGNAGGLAESLKRFIVADRLVVRDISREVCVLHVGEERADLVSRLEGAGLRVLCFTRCRRIASNGLHIVVDSPNREGAVHVLNRELGDPMGRQHYDHRRWVAGCAVFPEEINEQGMVLEFGLREALSFTKGCYVGQEVVERSDAIGKVARQLERIVLEGSSSVGVGSAINTASGEALGKVVGEVQAPQHGEVYLFALLRVGKYNGDDPVECGGRRGVVVSREGGME
jgi:folate-binding protein YgfZ